MINDITGITLLPGNMGSDCMGNGEHINDAGEITEPCCDECDYLQCCLEDHRQQECESCTDRRCPHAASERK